MGYKETEEFNCLIKSREKLTLLPKFCKEFFYSINGTTSAKTRLNYAQDLIIFFTFLTEEVDEFKIFENLTDIPIEYLEKITPSTLDSFLEYLDYYIKNNNDGTIIERTNGENGKSRKLSAVRRMLKYFFKKENISSNPGELVETPKIHEKVITRLEADEVALLLDTVENGEKLTEHQSAYHDRTKKRDLAIITLLLGTGMRVSECVGIDIHHIDFNINGVKVSRKGGKETVLYFGDEVYTALQDYLSERLEIEAKEGHEEALFLSMQKTRITPRAVQNLVKKYSSLVTPIKNISPHKLRSTYGTELYRQTGDIYLVADVLGHADVNTTKKHYAEMDDANRRAAPKYIKLREK